MSEFDSMLIFAGEALGYIGWAGAIVFGVMLGLHWARRSRPNE